MTRSEIKTLPFRPRLSLVSRLTFSVTQALTRRRDRRILARLDQHLLRDIGLTHEDAQSEVAKPFWRP